MLFVTYNANSICDLAFDIEICIVALNRQIVNTRSDRPLKPGIRNKTLRIVLRFQIKISLNVHVLALVFLFDTLTFASSI